MTTVNNSVVCFHYHCFLRFYLKTVTEKQPTCSDKTFSPGQNQVFRWTKHDVLSNIEKKTQIAPRDVNREQQICDYWRELLFPATYRLRFVQPSTSQTFRLAPLYRKELQFAATSEEHIAKGLMTFGKYIFNDILKNALACGTPEYRKWHPRVPRNPCWEPLI